MIVGDFGDFVARAVDTHDVEMLGNIKIWARAMIRAGTALERFIETAERIASTSRKKKLQTEYERRTDELLHAVADFAAAKRTCQPVTRPPSRDFTLGQK